MNNKKWNFAPSNYNFTEGFGTSDVETFKQKPYESLARELCQNSIDARLDKNKPVQIVFNIFKIKTNDIPGIDYLKEHIENSKNIWKNNKKEMKSIEQIERALSSEETVCARFSDFNTKGLFGVDSSSNETDWFNLTHGTGASYKTESMGGSKGIGKFATFVVSNLKTVFYSTYTKSSTNNENVSGHLGICKLCSAAIPNSDDHTRSFGYYSDSKKNTAISGQFSIDNFNRTETGTDVYIIGFNDKLNWKKRMISKILHSFMVAIVKGELIATIDDVVINSDTLSDVVSDKKLLMPSMVDSLMSQFLLLTSKETIRENITIDNYGDIELYVKSFTGESKKYATYDCVMVRYPYLRITEIDKVTIIPSSSLCIIKEGKLASFLRNIENAQHTKWEKNRIDDDDALRNEYDKVLKEMYGKIGKKINSLLISSDTMQTDIENAGEFLTDNNEGDFGDFNHLKDIPVISKPIPNVSRSNKSTQKSEDNKAAIDNIGDINDGENNGKETPIPQGHNSGNEGKAHETNNVGNMADGDNDILTYENVSGISFRMIVINAKHGEYAIKFNSPVTENNCYIELNSILNDGEKEKINILNATLNNENLVIKNGNIIDFSIQEERDYMIKLFVDSKRMFSSEVKLYAIR